jgi:hypothetical protein
MVYNRNEMLMLLLLLLFGLLVVLPTTVLVAHAEQSEKAEKIMDEIIKNIHAGNFSLDQESHQE